MPPRDPGLGRHGPILTRPGHHGIRPLRRRKYRTTGWPLVTSPGLTVVIALIAVAIAANLFFGG